MQSGLNKWVQNTLTMHFTKQIGWALEQADITKLGNFVIGL